MCWISLFLTPVAQEIKGLIFMGSVGCFVLQSVQRSDPVHTDTYSKGETPVEQNCDDCFTNCPGKEDRA